MIDKKMNNRPVCHICRKKAEFPCDMCEMPVCRKCCKVGDVDRIICSDCAMIINERNFEFEEKEKELEEIKKEKEKNENEKRKVRARELYSSPEQVEKRRIAEEKEMKKRTARKAHILAEISKHYL